jgi:hypothetical protein
VRIPTLSGASFPASSGVFRQRSSPYVRLGSRVVWTGPAARTPAESPKAADAQVAREAMSLGEQSSDLQGQHLVRGATVLVTD